jgi:hypothetical protein
MDVVLAATIQRSDRMLLTCSMHIDGGTDVRKAGP